MGRGVLLTIDAALAAFNLKERAVRAWIAAGYLRAVGRIPGPGGGAALFFKGDVAALAFGTCRACGKRYRRAKVSQVTCSPGCRLIVYKQLSKANP